MSKVIKIDYLSRVEGEGGITIKIKDGKIESLKLDIFEAPRFFESFLKGRSYTDVIDFVARICGICPVAYQMSAVHAIEKIFGIEPEKPAKDLRRLMYCGEWIESHALHMYMLQGPDFYGLESAWAGREYLEIAKTGLRFKKIGNQILGILGGRPIHPVSVRAGGFYKAPDKKDLLTLVPQLKQAYEESLKSIKWAAGLPFNNNILDMEYVSLSHESEYPMNYGSVVSGSGLNIQMDKFLQYFQEYQVEHSTSLHTGIKKDTSVNPYMVGPIARLNLNYDKLPEEIKTAVSESGISLPIKNTQLGIFARAVEIAYAFLTSISIIKDYEKPDRPFIDADPCAGEAAWITEAPRGMLIHRYKLDNKGYVQDCTIIPPTSQNLSHIEKDIYNFIQHNLDKPADFIKKESEKIIRSYDPCISCSVHLVILKG